MGARLLGSIGTLGRADKKHESYFIPGRSWAAISYQRRDHCYGKGMRSLTPVVEFRLLTAFKPHPSLFLLCPQQLIRKPGCSLFCEGEGDSHRASPCLCRNSHSGPTPDHNKISVLDALSSFSGSSLLPPHPCLSGLPFPPQRPQLHNPNLSIPSWCVQGPLSVSASEPKFE